MKKYMIGTYAESGEFFPLCEYAGCQGAIYYVNAPENETRNETINRFYETVDSEYIDEDNMMLKEITFPHVINGEIVPEEAENYICANPKDK